ncbi:MAG TPA: tRNA (guanosine(37)-N1)-methyltransferase TrmD [Oligoflexia bacterium]|nr:tRNA (guanosine(37)-N1)-methyltransferase TrmD [Oligoflexia bacterium]
MRYQILTIFPELFTAFKQIGLVGRGVEAGLLSVEATQLREFAVNAYGQVDDTPYGGGSGMVLRPEPAAAAIEAAKARAPKAKVVLFTPRGRLLTHELARELAAGCTADDAGVILLCCRYEGVDERIAQHWVDYEISIGDYVLMGGEVAAMALIEAISRFVPGVLGNPDSLAEESFVSGLLEYPQYTKPQEFLGHKVPEVLLSGHHAEIASWRLTRSKEDTQKRRPDLLKVQQASVNKSCVLDVALIHYPVLNKQGALITSSITNLDLHDIARSGKTYGIDRYYVVHPTKAMRKLAGKISDHWSVGYGAAYNPNRSEALDIVSVVSAFDDVLSDIEERTGMLPKLITTSANAGREMMSFARLRELLNTSAEPHLLLFGTGWGLAPEIMERADYRLEPVCGYTDYNHLSVRAAAAIIFDRLLGKVRQ